jgi:hypothetical protein
MTTHVKEPEAATGKTLADKRRQLDAAYGPPTPADLAGNMSIRWVDNQLTLGMPHLTTITKSSTAQMWSAHRELCLVGKAMAMPPYKPAIITYCQKATFRTLRTLELHSV